MRQKILTNERVNLIPLKTLDEAQPLEHQAILEPYLSKYSPSYWSDKTSFYNYFEEAIKSRFPYIIYDKSTNTYAGSTSFGNYDAKNERIEIGWTWLFSNHQRSGLNWNMKYLMLQFAFEELTLMRVEFKADSRNLQSRKAMEGIGAQYEGTLRSHTIMSDGYRRDTVYYSVLLDEWPAVSSHLLRRINK